MSLKKIKQIRMGKLITMHLKVNKPPMSRYAMCVYKFTLDTGFYYYGATTDLDDRISAHFKSYRKRKHYKAILDAMDNAKSITFEFVRFVNEKRELNKWEEHYLVKNVGLPLCLNNVDYSTSTHTRSEAINKVVKVDRDKNILNVYLSPSEAAIENGIRVSTVLSNCNAKYPITKTFLRRINEAGEIINPINGMTSPVANKTVRQYDKKMNFIKEFSSISEAGRSICCDRKNISDILRGKSKTAVGFIFREVDDYGKIIEPIYKGRKRNNKPSNSFKKSPKKPINKIDSNGNILETYRSLYMAMKTIPIDRRGLSKILKRNLYLNGYTYKYA